MDVAISGSSGLIGTALVEALTGAGHRPIRLVRRDPKPGADEIRWDPAAGKLDGTSLDGIDAVVNLAGAGVGDKRWTPSYRDLLVTSRTGSTSLLAETMAAANNPPKVFLSGSAIGYYGSQGATRLTEQSPPAEGDFLADLCINWEAAAKPATDAGIRTAFLRTGIVMSTEGGALSKLLPLFKLGVGGKFGSGDQYMSWVSIHDEVGMILHLLENDIAGPVNLTGPEPVTNAELTRTLGSVLGRPSLIPVPAFGPKLVLGSDRADALLFDSMRVMPEVIEGSTYQFQHTTIEATLRTVLNRPA